jgi:YhfZ C-terminal domain
MGHQMATTVKGLRRSLARDLMTVGPGERLSPIRTLAKRYRASVGATQEALASLATDGAIELDSHPGRGAILVSRDPGRLYRAAEPGPLLVCLSLPSTDRIHGLATAIKSRCVAAGLETYLVFTRGSRPRLDSVRQGRSHIAVVSALAADFLGPPDLVTELVLTPNSFVREHRVYFLEGRPQAGRLRVAVDPSSLDFERLTTLEFVGQDVELVGMNYLTTIRAIQAGTIDAAILDVEDALMRFPPDIGSRPLSPRVLTTLGDSNTRAAFVCRSEDVAVRAFVRECLDPTLLLAVQQEVMSGTRPPEY